MKLLFDNFLLNEYLFRDIVLIYYTNSLIVFAQNFKDNPLENDKVKEEDDEFYDKHCYKSFLIEILNLYVELLKPCFD